MRVVIMGSSRIAAVVTKTLNNKYKVIVLDTDEDGFRRLPEDFNGEKVVGSGTDIETYNKINFQKEDAFLAATNSDNTNIEAAKLIKENFKSEKIAKVIHNPMRARAFSEIEDGIICPFLDAALFFKDNVLGKKV